MDWIDVSMRGEYGLEEDIRNVFTYKRAEDIKGKVNIHLHFSGDTGKWTLCAEAYPVKMDEPWPLTARQKAGVDIRIILVEQSTMILEKQDGQEILKWIDGEYERHGGMSFRDCLTKVKSDWIISCRLLQRRSNGSVIGWSRKRWKA